MCLLMFFPLHHALNHAPVSLTLVWRFYRLTQTQVLDAI